MKARGPSKLSIAVAGVALAASTGCGATDFDGARATAERFYDAAAAKDGGGACELLGEDTRKQLEQDEQRPCAEAVLSLDLSGELATGGEAYLTEAKVDLDGGDSVFLEDTPDGWRVAAAGCRPERDQEAPYDCEVES